MKKQSCHAPASTLEAWIERGIFNCRWILAPIYFGLAVSMILLMIKFIEELGHMLFTAFISSELDVIMGVLTLVDLALIGSLLVIVIFAGYENFVSKIDFEDHPDWPKWMGTIDFSALKLKLLSSIVAISAVELLKRFISLREVTPQDERTLTWLIVIHMVFVMSSLLLSFSDRIASHIKPSRA